MMGRCSQVKLILLILALAPLADRKVRAATLPAFPGAEGAGQNATGGRGGDVYFVTNLNDSGPGSLRYGTDTATGPRTILFNVDGTIHLLSDLSISKPNLTIAGQSAPGGGITIADRETNISNTHDDIIQFMRFRVGDTYTQGTDNTYTPDSFGVGNSKNVMIDHVSASWSIDEALSVTHSSTNVTVQWSTISQALTDAGDPKGAHGYGSLINGGDITYSHNLYADNDSRNPRPSADTDGKTLHLDFVNNVIQNPGGHYGYSGTGDTLQMNYVGNYGIDGPSTTSGSLFNPASTTTQIYFSGNLRDSIQQDNSLNGTPATGSSLVSGIYTPLSQRINVTPVITTDARSAYIQVVSHAGASNYRDAVDTSVIRNVINLTGALIDSQNQVGSWPTLPTGTPAADSNHDGIPDWYAEAKGFPPSQAINNLIANNGYTYLENYLQSLTPHAFPSAHTQSINVSTTHGRGADAFVSENGGAPATSGGNGTGPSLNASWSGIGGTVNQPIILRFDLSHVVPGSITDASLNLTAFSNISGVHQLQVYGVEHSAPGLNWSEQSIQFDGAPGLTFAGDSGIRGLDPKSHDIANILNLGTLSVTTTLAGAPVSFNNANLAVFLNLLEYLQGTDQDGLVTLILEQTNSTSSEADFYSKEGSLDLAPWLSITGELVSVPEPAAGTLLAIGMAALVLLRRVGFART